jgi:hypothetical protein
MLTSLLPSEYGKSTAAGDGTTIFGVEVLDELGAPEPGSRRKPLESMMKWTPPNVASMSPCNPERVGRDVLLRGVNSKDPRRTESLEPEGVGDVSTNVVDVTGAADDVPCADSLPIDSAD